MAGAFSIGTAAPTLLQDESASVAIAVLVAALATPLDVLRTRTLQQLYADEDGNGVLDALEEP
jgi:hypothetical protein